MATKKKIIAPKDVEKKLKALSGWQLNKKHTELSKRFACTSFIQGLAFAAKIAVHAEVLNHHPEIKLTYGNVTVTLTTHDSGGITALDFDLAKRIDGIKTI